MKKQTIELPDGYNGHTIRCFTKPVEYDRGVVKLQCAEPGKEYMFKWAAWSEVFKARHTHHGGTL